MAYKLAFFGDFSSFNNSSSTVMDYLDIRDALGNEDISMKEVDSSNSGWLSQNQFGSDNGMSYNNSVTTLNEHFDAAGWMSANKHTETWSGSYDDQTIGQPLFTDPVIAAMMGNPSSAATQIVTGSSGHEVIDFNMWQSAYGVGSSLSDQYDGYFNQTTMSPDGHDTFVASDDHSLLSQWNYNGTDGVSAAGIHTETQNNYSFFSSSMDAGGLGGGR
jgi:hypothetical protein